MSPFFACVGANMFFHDLLSHFRIRIHSFFIFNRRSLGESGHGKTGKKNKKEDLSDRFHILIFYLIKDNNYFAARPAAPAGRPVIVPIFERAPEACTSNMLIELEPPFLAYKKRELLLSAMSAVPLSALPV